MKKNLSYYCCINIFLLLFATHSYDEATGTMDTGYPRTFEEDFPGMDDEVDAAAYHYGIIKFQIFSIVQLKYQPVPTLYCSP